MKRENRVDSGTRRELSSRVESSVAKKLFQGHPSPPTLPEDARRHSSPKTKQSHSQRVGKGEADRLPFPDTGAQQVVCARPGTGSGQERRSRRAHEYVYKHPMSPYDASSGPAIRVERELRRVSSSGALSLQHFAAPPSFAPFSRPSRARARVQGRNGDAFQALRSRRNSRRHNSRKKTYVKAWEGKERQKGA